MFFLLITGAILLFVLTDPGLIRRGIPENQSRILNVDWLSTEDRFRIVARWGAQY